FCIDRFVGEPEKPQGANHPTVSEVKGQPLLALRILRPAWQLQVRLSAGRPVNLTAVTKQILRAALQGRVLWSAGPWRSSGDWWTENARETSADKSHGPFDREEWDVALANKNGESLALYRIYRDLASGHWFADASYD